MPGKTFIDGWRGRIGLVATAPGNATEAEFNLYRPKGVAVLTTRTPLTSSTVEGIARMNDYIQDAAVMLAENSYCDVILLSSTAGSFINGPDDDEAFTRDLSEKTGTCVLSSCQCMMKALKRMNIRSVTLITPSSAGLNQAEKDYLTRQGITVAAEGSFMFSDPRDILCTSPQDVYSLAVAKDCPDSQAVLISCSGLHVMEIIDRLEADLEKPVLASNQFGLWGALREIGVHDRIEGAGKLFRT
jgi:maleate cis-trans isomerase